MEYFKGSSVDTLCLVVAMSPAAEDYVETEMTLSETQSAASNWQLSPYIK